MQVKTKAIVLSSVRYQEKSLIVKCFTQSQGVVSYFVPSAFSSKKNSQRIAYFQPLTILEIEATHKNKGSLEYFKEIKTAIPYQSIPFDIVKSTIVLFLAEILHFVIREEESNESLYVFFETSLIWLDTHDDVSNFHLIFLIELSKFLGFFPEEASQDDLFFDMSEGHFVSFSNVNTLTEYRSKLLNKLMQMRFETTEKVYTFNERQELLSILLEFYSVHLIGFKKPKSLEVFREIFNS